MEENFEEKLEKYLKKNGIEDTNKSKKEILKLLVSIVEGRKVDLDCLDLKFQSNKSCMTTEEYVERIHNLQINVTEGNYYLANVRGIIKEERRQAFFGKVKKLFGINKKNS